MGNLKIMVLRPRDLPLRPKILLIQVDITRAVLRNKLFRNISMVLVLFNKF